MEIFSTSTSEPEQLDLFRPRVVCGRYSGPCPVIELSSVHQLYCPRCDCVTAYPPTAVSPSA
jgi:hypothetical protein